jgi:tRNA (guanine37-N1)-methyltransferase
MQNRTGAGRRWVGGRRKANSECDDTASNCAESSRNRRGCPSAYRRRFRYPGRAALFRSLSSRGFHHNGQTAAVLLLFPHHETASNAAKLQRYDWESSSTASLHPMRFDIITIFPDFFRGPLDFGVLRRAREQGLVNVTIHDLRAFTHDRHQTVDDRPFGGGEGMVLKAQPIFECVESLDVASREERVGARETVVLLSAQGRLFHQQEAEALSKLEHVVLICGRYEGVDERVNEHLADRELSVGDFVLSGGELGAAMIIDVVARLIPGVLGNEASAQQESFSSRVKVSETDAPDSTCASGGLLDYPHYTRPADFRGWSVPEVLASGNHDEIRRWRRRKALEKTLQNRPELLQPETLSEHDRMLLHEASGLASERRKS